MSVFGGGYPQNAFVAPVSVMSRTVNVVYGDLSPGGSISSEFSEVIVCLSAAADAYERLIRERLLKEAVNKV